MKTCPICHRHWQFIHINRDVRFKAHFCDVAHRYVFWNHKDAYYIPDEEIYQNPPPRGDGE